MRRRCSTCGIAYPDIWEASTCRNCGGLIEHDTVAPKSTAQKAIELEKRWHDWRNKMFSAPPRPLKEEDWLQMCSVFNGCAICGSESIDEKLLVVPTYLGGKLYTYNVIPACSFCTDRIRQSQLSNPLKPFYTLKGIDAAKVSKIFNYLESLMLNAVFEEFNWEEDSVEIIVTVTEDTSCLPFNGVHAKRLYEEPKRITVEAKPKAIPVIYDAESYGVTWRLI